MKRSLHILTLFVVGLLVIALSVSSYTYDVSDPSRFETETAPPGHPFAPTHFQNSVMLGEVIDDKWPQE